MSKVDPKLSRARAYWRLASKARRARNDALAKHYTALADHAYRGYIRNREYLARLKKER